MYFWCDVIISYKINWTQNWHCRDIILPVFFIHWLQKYKTIFEKIYVGFELFWLCRI